MYSFIQKINTKTHLFLTISVYVASVPLFHKTYISNLVAEKKEINLPIVFDDPNHLYSKLYSFGMTLVILSF